MSRVSGATTGVAPRGADGDRVDEEAVLGVDHLVARAEIAVRQQVEDVVRAGAADDAVRVEAMQRAAMRRAERRAEPSG